MIKRTYSLETARTVRRAAHLAAALHRELWAITADGATGLWDVAHHPERFGSLRPEVEGYAEAAARAAGIAVYLQTLDRAIAKVIEPADRDAVLREQPNNPFEGWKST
jgi:hypothetical protein